MSEPHPISEAAIVRRAPRTAARVIDGKAVVVVIDAQKVHSLNEVGTVLWEHLDGRSLGEVVDAVVREFEVSRPTALEDTRRFIHELAALGALEVGDVT